MPPRLYSRYTYSKGILDENKNLYLTRAKKFTYRERSGTIRHKINLGDTLFSLADKYYSALYRPAAFWWLIADFQPDPIHDPTISLQEGSILLIPSLRLVEEEVFNIARESEDD